MIRARVLGDIAGSPGWYLGILARRAGRVLTEIAPVRIHRVGGTIHVPFAGWLAVPLFAWLVQRRERFLAKILAFTAPLSLLPLLVYSGGNTTRYAVYPSVAFAILVWLGLGRLLSAARRARPRRLEAGDRAFGG